MRKYLLASLLCASAFADAETTNKELKFGAFLDTYYAFDTNQPSGDRSFTTQATRQNEFSVSLAYVDMNLEKSRVHGRLALQAGSAVYANYAGERAANAALGSVLQHVQEAYGGYRLADNLWLDAGIFLSHIGAESFISKYNWTYTRSLGADFSPYYQTGARLSYKANDVWFFCLHVLNGWQNIIETNTDKALGAQVSYTPAKAISITYNNFIGREKQFRFFNDFIVKIDLTDRLSLSFSSDLGLQKKASGSGYSIWYVETLLSRFRLSETLYLGARVEYFHDADQVVATTNTSNGMQTMGASLNLDWQPETSVLIRNEVRALSSIDAVFPGSAGAKASDLLYVASLALSF